jgi:hypothetical protein
LGEARDTTPAGACAADRAADDAVVRAGVLRRDSFFLEKPFTAEVLARKIREVFDSREAVTAMS